MPETLTAPAPAAAAPAPKPAALPAKPSTAAPAAPKAAVPPATAEPELSAEGKEFDDKLSSAFGFKGPDKAKDAAPAKEPAATEPPPKDKKIPTMDEAPKHFRDQYESVKAKAAAAEQKISEYETKIKDAEKHGESIKALTATLEAKEKALNDLQGEMRALKRETSPDFKEKWDKPFNDAMKYAAHDVVGLTVTDSDAGTERPATWEDFQALYALPKSKAILKAQEMFGHAAPIVTDHLKELQRHDYNRTEALNEEKAKWQTKIQEDAAKEAQGKVKQEESKKAFSEKRDKDLKAFEESKPELYGEIPGDDEGNALRLKSQQAFAKQIQTPDELIAHQVETYHKATNFDREHYLRTKAEKERDELKAENEDLKSSGPGKTRRGSAEVGESNGETWAAEARRTAGNRP